MRRAMRDAVRESQAFFAGKAEAYRTSASHASRADLDRMIAWLAPRRGARALDVATGGGHTAIALAEAGCRAIATDITRSMLEGVGRTASERGLRVERVAAEAGALPVKSGAFDVVASRIAPHHFPDLAAFVRESARVLAPGGALYAFDLTTPEPRQAAALIDAIERLRDPSHASSHPPSAWRRVVEAAGLVIERLETRASDMDLEPWLARAEMTREREREVRRLLAENPPEGLGGYGIVAPGRMRVLRVEILARKPA